LILEHVIVKMPEDIGPLYLNVVNSSLSAIYRHLRNKSHSG